jgi:alkanesulfonate monooxygenase SsuD/methylene tetrahydromethanopterin reductase-like flavin-dependent oxidoreductase (luciferase family)
VTQFALYLTNQHPAGTDMRAGLAESLQLFREVRESGWDMVFTGHHYLSSFAQFQPVPFLARLAAEAEHLTLGLGVQLISLLNPLDVAEHIATLDAICGGRFIYGVGLGYRDVEFAALGVPTEGKAARFEANLDIIVRLLEGESVTVDHPWCRLEDASLAALPAQRPRPPLWIAANGDRAVERAGRLGDTWMINPHARTDTIVRQLELFHEARRAADRGPLTVLPLMKEVFCAPTREEAIRVAAPYLGAKYEAYAKWGQDAALPGDETFALPFEELLEDRFVLGTPDDCLAQLAPWRELGVDTFVIRSHWPGMPVDAALSSLRLITDEVMPALRA